VGLLDELELTHFLNDVFVDRIFEHSVSVNKDGGRLSNVAPVGFLLITFECILGFWSGAITLECFHVEAEFFRHFDVGAVLLDPIALLFIEDGDVFPELALLPSGN